MLVYRHLKAEIVSFGTFPFNIGFVFMYMKELTKVQLFLYELYWRHSFSNRFHMRSSLILWKHTPLYEKARKKTKNASLETTAERAWQKIWEQSLNIGESHLWSFSCSLSLKAVQFLTWNKTNETKFERSNMFVIF